VRKQERAVSTAGPVTQFLTTSLGASPSTIHLCASRLRKSALLPSSKSGFGAAQFSSSDGVDLMVAVTVAPSNTQAATTVQRMRNARLTSVHPLSAAPPENRVRAAFDVVSDLGIRFEDDHTAGSMLDIVIESMRSSSFGTWAGDQGYVTIDFHDGTRGISIYFDRGQGREAAVFSFDENRETPPPPVERMTRINNHLLIGLAKTLGPLSESAIPPPS